MHWQLDMLIREIGGGLLYFADKNVPADGDAEWLVYGCICNNCLYNCELFSAYFTPGEIKDVEDVCYCCDECKWFDGDYTKRSQWRKSCEKFRLPAKYKEHLEQMKQKEARVAVKRRMAFTVIKGGKKDG